MPPLRMLVYHIRENALVFYSNLAPIITYNNLADSPITGLSYIAPQITKFEQSEHKTAHCPLKTEYRKGKTPTLVHENPHPYAVGAEQNSSRHPAGRAKLCTKMKSTPILKCCVFMRNIQAKQEVFLHDCVMKPQA